MEGVFTKDITFAIEMRSKVYHDHTQQQIHCDEQNKVT